MDVSRREALVLGGVSVLGAAGLTLPMGAGVQAKSASSLASKNMPKPYANAFRRPAVLTPSAANGYTVEVTAKAAQAGIVPGLQTTVYGYNGQVPGPIIRNERGRPCTVRVRNHLPAAGNPLGGPYAISTHLHGSESAPQFDGYASDITPVGSYKDYEFPNSQPARTLWYHDHGVHWTAQNAYGGLAAQYHITDPEERELLPQGEFDVPVTVTDAMFKANGSLAYDDSSTSGLWGDVILVNGTPWPVMKVKRRTYRFRILVAGIARSYRWRLSNGLPLQVVAHDGGLAPKGVAVQEFRHAGAERYEVVVDFSGVAAGTRVELLNRSNPNNVDYDNTGKVMAFDVVGDPVDTSDPTWNRNYDGFTLRETETMSLQPTGKERVVRLRLERKGGLWTINGKTWEDVIDSDFREAVATPDLDEVQVWEIENRSGGWFHPLHIHLIDFQILTRNGKPRFAYEAGPKDVVYVGENETVRLLCKFASPSNRTGRYMVHCHNLPHEDHDMMVQFNVGDVDPDTDPNDPIKAAPPVPDPAYRA